MVTYSGCGLWQRRCFADAKVGPARAYYNERPDENRSEDGRSHRDLAASSTSGECRCEKMVKVSRRIYDGERSLRAQVQRLNEAFLKNLRLELW